MQNNTLLPLNDNASLESMKQMKSAIGEASLAQLSSDSIEITSQGVEQIHHTRFGDIKTLLTNFHIVSACQRNIISDRGIKFEVSLSVVNTTTGEKNNLTVEATKLTNPRWIIEKLGPKYTHEKYQAIKKIIDIIICNADIETLCTQSGWGKNNYFVAGNVMLGTHPDGYKPHESIKGASFVCTTISRNEKEAAEGINAIEKLFECTDDVQMEIMFLAQLLTIMTTLFRRNALSMVPNFTLVLLGVSGTGKTTLMKSLFSCYTELARLDLSLGFTQAAFYKLAEVMKDHPLWLDDLVNGDDSYICDIVNAALRAAGNSGSSRVTANGKSSVESLVFMTMEVIPDTMPMSSIDRMLTVEIEKGNVNFEQTKQFFMGETRKAYSRAINDIISYIAEEDPDGVAKGIFSNFMSYCQKLHADPATKECSDRHLEDYAWLLAAEQFFNEYTQVKGYFQVEGKDQNALFNYAVKELKEETIERKMNMPEYIFCCKLVESIGKFQDRKLAEELKPDSYGFHDDDNFFITEMSMDKLLSNLGFSHIQCKLLKQLRSLGLLIPEIGRGLKYRLNSGTSKFIMYRFSREKIQNFIQQINDEIDADVTMKQLVGTEEVNDNE